jgi:cellulose synthase/poly-beta-1,6-N-acetylglucosamine synthase-like glycosyltransferase
MLEWVFWVSAAAIAYAYAGYPLLLALLGRVWSRPPAPGPQSASALPGITMIVPVHNEAAVMPAKLENTHALEYPRDRLQVLFVSDGSIDGTCAAIEAGRTPFIDLLALPVRQGKAAALNAGLERVRHPIVVFSDASIMLDRNALVEIARPFARADIGCVSGEDRIAGGGGEGLYGRYELFLRGQESAVCSIVGASGSFYAQRRELCAPFVANVAPDFLSVLRTVEHGYRAVTEPRAAGLMSALSSAADEFHRKVRTINRGLTTLAHYAHLLNPLRYGFFAVELWSHKLARWLVPFFLLAMLASSAALASGSTGYLLLFLAQLAFYGVAGLSLLEYKPLAASLPVRVSLYFTVVNLATLVAWRRFLTGARQELWSPTRRSVVPGR